MFESATVKLTSWYLLILMCISLLFSIIIYQIATSEVSVRLEGFQEQVVVGTAPGGQVVTSLRDIRRELMNEAAHNIILYLLYTNIFVLLAGGVGAYFLARRTLTPLKAAHDAQARFTSDASHELRTPLAAMKTELEVALRDPKLAKTEMRELLSSNLEEVNKLSDLSTTLLKISRSDEHSLTMSTFNLSDLLNSIPKRTGSPKRFVVKHPPSDLPLTANRVSIEEVLLIICDNALKYSTPGSKIHMSAKRRAGKIHISVTNRGEGIKKDQQERIFDRFYRGDLSRTESGTNGYGLGLSLARQLVHMHNGTISVSSTPGKTTTFTISLPSK